MRKSGADAALGDGVECEFASILANAKWGNGQMIKELFRVHFIPAVGANMRFSNGKPFAVKAKIYRADVMLGENARAIAS